MKRAKRKIASKPELPAVLSPTRERPTPAMGFAALGKRWREEVAAYNTLADGDDAFMDRIARGSYDATERAMLAADIVTEADYVTALDFIEHDLCLHTQNASTVPGMEGSTFEETALAFVRKLRNYKPPSSRWVRDISGMEDEICEVEDRAIMIYDVITDEDEVRHLPSDDQRWNAICRVSGDLLRVVRRLKAWFYDGDPDGKAAA
jgi:hypothetical protein